MEPRAEDELDRMVRDALVGGTGDVRRRLTAVPGVRTGLRLRPTGWRDTA